MRLCAFYGVYLTCTTFNHLIFILGTCTLVIYLMEIQPPMKLQHWNACRDPTPMKKNAYTRLSLSPLLEERARERKRGESEAVGSNHWDGQIQWMFAYMG